MDLQIAGKLAQEVSSAYDTMNRTEGRPTWTASDYLTGLVVDVGDLAKLVQGASGARQLGAFDVSEALEHELADCLWSILMIADRVAVDLAEVFPREMERLLRRLDGEMRSQRTDH